MAKARVEYVGGLSHSARGMSFTKGEAKIITNPDDILYFTNAGGFLVVTIAETPAKAQALAPAPPLVVDDEEGDEDDADIAAGIDDDLGNRDAPPPPTTPMAPVKPGKKPAPPPTPKKNK